VLYGPALRDMSLNARESKRKSASAGPNRRNVFLLAEYIIVTSKVGPPLQPGSHVEDRRFFASSLFVRWNSGPMDQPSGSWDMSR
jgi:hypothetical protein